MIFYLFVNKRLFENKMSFNCVFLFLFFVFLSGCSAFKKRQGAPLVFEKVNLKSSIDQAVSDVDFVQGEWPKWNWWTQFEDDQLTAFMEQSIRENLNLKAAIARVCSSWQEAEKTRSMFFPHFYTSFEDDYQHLSKDNIDRFPPSNLPAVINQVNLKLNFEYEIDLFGKNRELYRAAIGEVRVQKAEMSQAYLMVTVSLAQAYFDYQANLLHIQIQKEIVNDRKIFAECIKQRFINNIEDELSMQKTAADFLHAKEMLVAFEKKLALAKSQIKIIMGLSPDESVDFEIPQAHFDRPFPIPENLPVDLLVRRADLMIQIWKVESAAHLIGAARAAFFPNINLAAFAGLETLTWNKLLNVDSFAGAISPAINLPLFKGGRLRAELEKSFADFDAAVFDYNSLILKAAKDVSDGLKILEAVNHEVEYQKEAVSSFRKASDLSYARFKNGISNYLDLIQVRLALFEQMAREVDMQNNRYLAILNLIRVLGGGYESVKIEDKNG